MAAKSEGIYKNDDGTVDFFINGGRHHLARPKLGQIRTYEEWLSADGEKVMSEVRRGNELERSLTDDMAEDERSKIKDDLNLILRSIRENTVPWIKSAFDELSDKPLPEDPDDWPAWLVRDTTVPHQIVKHWNTAPLHPG